jgi:hypothetical protein
VAHLLRRCREMMGGGATGAAEFPATVKSILQADLRLRDRRDQGEIRPQKLAAACGQL